MEETTLNNDIHVKLTEKFGEKVTAVSEPYGFLTFVTYKDVTKTYKVKKGDNLGTIAKKYGSSVDDLKLWNNLEYILMNSVILYHKDIIVILESISVKNTHLLLHIHILVLLINKTSILC